MKRVGLFVGIDKYGMQSWGDNIPELQCAKNDAEKLAECFGSRRFDERISLVDDEAALHNISNTARKMIGDLEQGDLFVLYFAGHGIEIGGKHYLLCANAANIEDPDANIRQGLLSIESFDRMAQSKGLKRLYILDCCRTALGGRDATAACSAERDISLGNWVNSCGDDPPLVLNSCRTGQKAIEDRVSSRGIFTLALESVLKNEQVKNLRAAYDMLVRQVWQDSAKRQQPVFSGDYANDTEKILREFPLFADWESKTFIDHAPETEKPDPVDPNEQFALGRQHYYGDGADKNPARAAELFLKAAEQGHAEAQYAIGECFRLGEGVPKSNGKAARWYRKAALQGHAEAQFAIGECYNNARGVIRNRFRAAAWYRKAARQGHAAAKTRLGECYYYKRGVLLQNRRKAIELFWEASKTNDPDALFNLGICHFHGSGTTRDIDRAADFIIRSGKEIRFAHLKGYSRSLLYVSLNFAVLFFLSLIVSGQLSKTWGRTALGTTVLMSLMLGSLGVACWFLLLSVYVFLRTLFCWPKLRRLIKNARGGR